ncbi:hypothetical protein SAMN04490179_4618 [Pseudomonas antarctica]|uniref:Uncharacterized protein n=1 Tax=Pseudomonas antarctica TaxID=219572 RepID=A0A1H0C2F9_9PSED|nr:hypothetical protein PSAN_49570 [Pseudomonas antarctica]SDN52098.1 hypothetical protein SAMN04490179_4618 [Pseudomonas antarctica]
MWEWACSHMGSAFTGTVINFVFGHNMLKRCMYANHKETGPQGPA